MNDTPLSHFTEIFAYISFRNIEFELQQVIFSYNQYLLGSILMSKS